MTDRNSNSNTDSNTPPNVDTVIGNYNTGDNTNYNDHAMFTQFRDGSWLTTETSPTAPQPTPYAHSIMRALFIIAHNASLLDNDSRRNIGNFSDDEARAALTRRDTLMRAISQCVQQRSSNDDHTYQEAFARCLAALAEPVSTYLDYYRDNGTSMIAMIAKQMRIELRKQMDYICLVVGSETGLGALRAEYSIRYGDIHNSHVYSAGVRRRHVSNLIDSGYDDDDIVRELLDDAGHRTCNDCGAMEHEHNMHTPYDASGEVCSSCTDNNYRWSDYYDLYIHNDNYVRALDEDGNRVYVDRDDGDFHYDEECDNAGEICYLHFNYSHPSRILRNYHSTKNNDAFTFIESDWTKRTKRFMGVELEVEVKNANTSNVLERLNDEINDGDVGRNVFFEKDGSLSDSGFEIITNPMGLDKHTEFWEWLKDEPLTKSLRSHDTSTCGLHVHVSREHMSQMQLNKMSVFINHPDNAELISKIARRYNQSYARIAEKKLGHAHYGRDRYDALNLENRHTVEFRIFKGTIKYTSLMAAIEFCNALVEFTLPASPAGFNLSTPRFMNFICSDAVRSETKFLRLYLGADDGAN